MLCAPHDVCETTGLWNFVEEKMKHLACAAAATIALLLTCAAFAQANYPTKPIRFIVPFPPGGSTDFLSRLITTKMTEILGWQIVVDNRAGAGGTIGT